MLQSASTAMGEMLANGRNALSTGCKHFKQTATLAWNIRAHVFSGQRVRYEDGARGHVRNAVALGAEAGDMKVARLTHRVTPQAGTLRCPIRL